MNKIWLDTLYPRNHLWRNEHEREHLRQRLNDLGFYVIHGKTESILEVYAVEYEYTWIDKQIERLI